MKINTSQINLVLSLIFLAIFCGVFYFLNIKIEENNANAESSNILWQQEIAKKAQLKSLKNGLKTIENQKINFEKHFVSNSDLVPFLDAVEGLGSQTNSNVETTSVDLSPDGASLIVGVKAKGSFSSIYQFILLLENSPFELEVLSMDITRQAPSVIVKVPDWEATFRLRLISFIK